MASGYAFSDLHAQRVQVELNLGGRCVTVLGIAEYDRGELRIALQDSAGDFTLVLDDAQWNGELVGARTAMAFLFSLPVSIND